MRFTGSLRIVPLGALGCALLLAGCTTTRAERDLRKRQEGYQAALASLKMGGTRADLVRLLPPTRPAKPHQTNLAFPASKDGKPSWQKGALANWWATVGNRPAGNWGVERHPLDADFEILVAYEYRSYRLVRSARPLFSVGKLDQNAIDALLFGNSTAGGPLLPTFRVVPSPRDRIVTNIPPTVRRRPDTPGTITHPTYSPEPHVCRDCFPQRSSR